MDFKNFKNVELRILLRYDPVMSIDAFQNSKFGDVSLPGLSIMKGLVCEVNYFDYLPLIPGKQSNIILICEDNYYLKKNKLTFYENIKLESNELLPQCSFQAQLHKNVVKRPMQRKDCLQYFVNLTDLNRVKVYECVREKNSKKFLKDCWCNTQCQTTNLEGKEVGNNQGNINKNLLEKSDYTKENNCTDQAKSIETSCSDKSKYKIEI